jgi:hypothetical protein
VGTGDRIDNWCTKYNNNNNNNNNNFLFLLPVLLFLLIIKRYTPLGFKYNSPPFLPASSNCLPIFIPSVFRSSSN